MVKLSVVLPVYREAEGLRLNVDRLRSALRPHGHDFEYEIILVNDGSPDGSLDVMESLYREAPETIRIVSLIRNFGQVAAIFAGLARAAGECVAVMSSDMQDPPELIPEMFKRWREGARTVLAVRGGRHDGLQSALASRVFYASMRRFALPALPSGGFDFFLLDATVVRRMLANPEPNAFLQGQVLFASGTASEIRYTRLPRTTGRSSWGVLKKLKYLIDGFIGFSFAPIRLISLLGALLFCSGILLSAGLVAQRLFFGTRSPGWTSLMIAMLLFHGLETLMIGVLGEYLWRTLDQCRSRPLYIVDFERGTPPTRGAAHGGSEPVS